MEALLTSLANSRPIVFVGTMNAMPMMYAFELKKAGHNVVYIVDVPPSDVLSRPEHHFPGIEYPYPDWILEFRLPAQIISALTPEIILRAIKRRLKTHGIDLSHAVVVTTGFHHCILDRLPDTAIKIGLSFGADLDTWAHQPGAATLYEGLRWRSIFKILPPWIGKRLVAAIVRRQFAALQRAHGVIYFAHGLNEHGDRVTDALEAHGVTVVRRHDASHDPVAHAMPKQPGSRQTPLFLLSPVRFLFRTFVEGCAGYDKGNDRILEGVAQFAEEKIPFVLHLFEKGEDLQAARDLVESYGLAPHVVWHKEMPFSELLKLYEQADIVFDQVGSHWVAGSGIYALYLGLPLIANANNLVAAGIIPHEHPISNATNASEVRRQLVRLADGSNGGWTRDQVKEFALKHFGPGRVVQYIQQMALRT